MAHEIRYAGVSEQCRNRLRQAAPILTMHSVSLHAAGIHVDEWNGQECDLLVAEATDETGRAAMAQANEQGIPVVAITDGQDVAGADFSLTPDSSTATLTRTLKLALSATV